MVKKVAVCSPNSGLETGPLSLSMNQSISKASIGPALVLARTRSHAWSDGGRSGWCSQEEGNGEIRRTNKTIITAPVIPQGHVYMCVVLGKPKSGGALTSARLGPFAVSIIIGYESFGSTIYISGSELD